MGFKPYSTELRIIQEWFTFSFRSELDTNKSFFYSIHIFFLILCSLNVIRAKIKSVSFRNIGFTYILSEVSYIKINFTFVFLVLVVIILTIFQHGIQTENLDYKFCTVIDCLDQLKLKILTFLLNRHFLFGTCSVSDISWNNIWSNIGFTRILSWLIQH